MIHWTIPARGFQRPFLCVGTFCLIACLLLSPAQVKANDPEKGDQVPVLEFKQFTLQGDLPYGRYFRIQGPAKYFAAKPGETVDFMRLQIIEERTAKEVYSGYWSRNLVLEQAKKDQFEFYVNTVLLFKTKYQLVFTYYLKSTVDSATKEQLVQEIRQELDQRAESGTIQYDEVQQVIRDVQQNLNGSVYNLGDVVQDAQGEITMVPLNELSVPQATLKKLAVASLLAQNIEQQTRKQESALKAMEQFRNQQPTAYQQFFANLDSIAQDSALFAQIAPGGNKDDFRVSIQTLKATVDAGTLSEDALAAVPARLWGESGGVPSALVRGNQELLQFMQSSLRSSILVWRQSTKALSQLREQAKNYQVSNEAIARFLADALLREATYSTKASPVISSATELETVRIGTTVGGGLVYFNTFNEPIDRNGVTDMFSYTGLKFYFRPVDKRLIDPYLPGNRLINRASLLAGIMVGGTLNYKGQEMQNALGAKPVIGLSYDVTRYITFDVGSVWFKQESLSPLENSSSLRTALFFGFSIDPDLLNRLNTLFTGGKYKVTLPTETAD